MPPFLLGCIRMPWCVCPAPQRVLQLMEATLAVLQAVADEAGQVQAAMHQLVDSTSESCRHDF